MIFSRLISASLSPNAEKDDILLAFRVLFSPTRWITGGSRQMVEKWFAKYINNSNVLTFNSGRSALYMILRAFGIGREDEVILQAFTCVAVPNSVIWTGATPIYVDIDSTYNMDPSLIESKITQKTKAIIVQHTFGIPAKMNEIMALAKKHNLWVIEDCAHSLGATYKGKKLGTIGDAAIFSFGRDKIISSVFGGLGTIAKKHADAWTKLKELHGALSYPSGFWVVQQLIHPIAFGIILPWYRLTVGKVVLWLLQKIGILGFPVYSEEKQTHRPLIFTSKYPNGLATLLLLQLKKLDRYNAKRKARVAQYIQALQKKEGLDVLAFQEGAVYLRYPILVGTPAGLQTRAKRSGVLLGNWYHNVIDPTGVDFARVQYKKGSCPQAEAVAERIINLPTNISEQSARRVIKEIR
jgi:dTDP-4-amino-4,6-dideoxygalactose transaminase